MASEIRQDRTSINVEPVVNIPKLMNPNDINTTLVYTTVDDNLDAVIIFSSSLRHFLRMIDILLNKKIDYYSALNEDNEPVVAELGNIINGYFVSSLNKLFDMKFKFSEAEISVNPYRAIEEFGLGDVYKRKISVLTFKSNFKVQNEDIDGKVFMLADKEKTDMFLDAISRKVKIV